MCSFSTGRPVSPISPAGLVACAAALLVLKAEPSAAAPPEDAQHPGVEFAREGTRIRAHLTPRTKATAIFIDFEVAGGELLDVRWMEFEKAAHPDADAKDFRSDLFVVTIGSLTPEGRAKVSVSSDYFTRSTRFWVHNRLLPDPWMDAEAGNVDRAQQVQELVVHVDDGGRFDADGARNGRIVLVGGPRDDFWGYALGTLFIRFFGIFLVLSVLMLGMMAAGFLVQRLEGRSAAPSAQAAPGSGEREADVRPSTGRTAAGPEMAAAIALAFRLRRPGAARAVAPASTPQAPGPWASRGRERLMEDRFLVFHRGKRAR